jgi:hypothetical protein
VKKNPPCICLEVFTDAAFGRVDRSAWVVEYEHYVLDGHVASCHHRSAPPKGILAPDYNRQHRIFARILDDMISGGA